MDDKQTILRYGRINWFALVIGILLLVKCFSQAYSEISDTLYYNEIKGSLLPVTATVVDFWESSSTSTSSDSGSTTTYTYYPIVKYDIDGEVFVKQFDSARANSFGAQVKLLYNPADPGYAVLDDNKGIPVSSLALYITSFTLGIFMLFIFKSSVQKRRTAKNALLDFEETGDEKAFGASKAQLCQSERFNYSSLKLFMGVICILVGLAIPFIVNNETNTTKNAKKKFNPVTATVVDNRKYLTKEGNGGGGRIRHASMAEYEVDGRTYVRLLNGNGVYEHGRKLRLMYEPSNHGYTIFADANTDYSLFVSLIGVIFFVPFGCIIIKSYIK